MDMIKFPSPFGDKLQLMNDIMDDQKVEFPSPCGDKLQFLFPDPVQSVTRFRPLAEISYNEVSKMYNKRQIGFRPLAGINYNGKPY